MNIALWSERFREHLRLGARSERTLESYLWELRQFLQFLADRGVSQVHEIRREEVDAYRVHLHHHRKPDGKPLAVKTQATRLHGVLCFLRFLYQEQYLLMNPGQGISGPKVPPPLPASLLDEEQVIQLLEAPDTSTPLGLRDRAVLEVLYSSGLRNTELRKLECGDFDLGRLEVHVRFGKGNKQRMVPLGEPAAAWVEEYFQNGRPWLVKRPNEWAFLSWRGNRLGRDALGVLVRRHAKAAGLKRVTPHLLRHCCATHMLKNQAGLRHLQEMLGHASVATTQRYTQVVISDLREVHQRCHPREKF